MLTLWSDQDIPIFCRFLSGPHPAAWQIDAVPAKQEMRPPAEALPPICLLLEQQETE